MNTKDHFDCIAPRYDREIPEHIRKHLIDKKTYWMQKFLSSSSDPIVSGLDCGCGTGHYLIRMSEYGYRMTGFEYSTGMRKIAKHNVNDPQINIELGSITEIPFEEGRFDFSYTINVLHHLPDKESQIRAIEEMLRVVRPGGFVFIQDFNADSILTRIYMNYVFPLTSNIDDDETEIWLSPKSLSKRPFPHGEFVETAKFTLIPNFLPLFLFPTARSMESLIESASNNRVGAHFLMVLKRSE